MSTDKEAWSQIRCAKFLLAGYDHNLLKTGKILLSLHPQVTSNMARSHPWCLQEPMLNLHNATGCSSACLAMFTAPFHKG
ncbi:hypothetical protein PILCRDRAFT_818677 [Piloderma croceum F 1598]|uniref:Uncharacterized protein n=1 Tax=Piloderma croceum (strain F 1598) TaxID=765440 RepID=A0A0C3FIV6_PILCF|nr:hypothetical protein PILCRDRAFT_818677 [Piloderma croceum F 1598]